MDRPAPIFANVGNGSEAQTSGSSEPSAHRTLPPMNWSPGSSPNPATYENHLSGNEGSETAEFGLNVPRQQVSRNWLVVVVAAVALIAVTGGVAAWLLIFQDDNSVSDEVDPAVLVDEPRPQVIPVDPIDPPKPPPVQAEPAAEPVEPEPIAAVEPEPDRPRRRSKRRNGGSKRRSSSSSKPSNKVVDSLSDSAISKGFGRAKSAIAACGRQHGALDGASFRVTFDINNGSASNVSVQRPQNVTPLGRCVKKAIENSARFTKSREPKAGVTRTVKF
jgi:type IV secretory pathway VirB10-like protein